MDGEDNAKGPDLEVGGVEVDDGRARVGHEELESLGQELHRGLGQAAQQLLEGQEGSALDEGYGDGGEAGHVGHHGAVVEGVEPAPRDTACVEKMRIKLLKQ